VLEEKNVSQSRLSRMSDVSLNTLQEMVHDPFRDAKLSTLHRIAKALKLTVLDLYEELPDPQRDE
jgi:hypothetical protein